MATEELKGDELDSVLDDLQRRMDRLRVMYEQYFLGIEKTPPYQPQKDVVRIIYRLQQAKIVGAQGKFRIQSLIQRFNAHRAYWTRTTREIEDGTHRRQTFRAAERRKKREVEDVLTSADHLAIRMIKDTLGEEAAEKAEAERRAARTADLADAASAFLSEVGGAETPEPSTPRAPERVQQRVEPVERDEPRRPVPEIRGMSTDDIVRKKEMLESLRRRVAAGGDPRAAAAAAAAVAPRDADREVYDRLVAMKRRLNEPTDSLSLDSVRQSLAKQRERVREKHGCDRVEFDVVVKEGRAFLKPIPIKEGA